ALSTTGGKPHHLPDSRRLPRSAGRHESLLACRTRHPRCRGKTDGYIIPPTGGAGLKFGSGLHKERWPDADAGRAPLPGEGEEVRDLLSPPIARIREYAVADTVTCAYTFTVDERFFGAEIGKALVVSACSGHGYKFGAAVGRRVADVVESGDAATLLRWLRAEI